MEHIRHPAAASRPVRPWEALLALLAGAVLVAGASVVEDVATRGRLAIVPSVRTITARAGAPVVTTFRLVNRGRGTIHLLGVSGG